MRHLHLKHRGSRAEVVDPETGATLGVVHPHSGMEFRQACEAEGFPTEWPTSDLHHIHRNPDGSIHHQSTMRDTGQRVSYADALRLTEALPFELGSLTAVRMYRDQTTDVAEVLRQISRENPELWTAHIRRTNGGE